MNYNQQISAYKTLANILVGSKNTVNSIEPSDVADLGLELADLLLPILNKINDFNITGGVTPPQNEVGGDLDMYIQGGAQLIFWRKRNGAWTNEAEVDLGIQIVDGNISLQSSVKDSLVTVSAGNWGINNVIYTKAVQTQFNLNDADQNYNRIDTIYANENGNVFLVNGIANSNPLPGAKPNNSVLVTYIYVPSSASGNPPYISDSNTPVIEVTGNDIKTNITVPDGNKIINWQTDLIPNTQVTYLSKHGNSIANIQGHYDAGGGSMTPYSPNYSYTLNNDGNINVLTLTEVFAGTITII